MKRDSKDRNILNVKMYVKKKRRRKNLKLKDMKCKLAFNLSKATLEFNLYKAKEKPAN